MDPLRPSQFGTAETQLSAGADILLLADTGPMLRLLKTALPELTVTTEDSLLEAVVRLGSYKQGFVLVNAEHSARHTCHLVRALQDVSPESTIILFGRAYAEVFCQDALQQAAADFLTWPIRAAELRLLWQNTQRKNQLQISDMPYENPMTPDTSASPNAAAQADINAGSSQAELMTAYQHLAYLVPQGLDVLKEQTEYLLAKVLRLDRINIKTSTVSTGRTTPPKARYDTAGRLISVNLFDVHGSAGEMLLGLPTAQLPDRERLALQAGQLVATLLHLAQRDASLRRLAITDELTGAYNRRYLEHFVQQIIAQSQQQPTQITLLLFDIDQFKHYNDTYGHAAGDEILREIYILMRRCCRAHDVVARLGGDEFVVLFWDSGEQRERFDKNDTANKGQLGPDDWDHEQMVTFMSNRFRRIVKTNCFPMLGSEARGVLSISGGLATYPQGGTTLGQLLATADAAMLDAKRSGKNQIGLFGATPQQTG